jgi:hypothetical protein
MERQYMKRIIVPPFVVAACWSIFIYGGVIRFMSPKWDYISVFCFAALVLGLLIVPCATLAKFIYWLRSPSQDKVAARNSFIGWGLALVLLFAGFTIVPWGKGWP